VLRVEEGKFGFLDIYNARLEGKQRLACEMTIRERKKSSMISTVWAGLTGPHCPKIIATPADPHWDGTVRRRCAAWCHNFRRVRPDHALKLTDLEFLLCFPTRPTRRTVLAALASLPGFQWLMARLIMSSRRTIHRPAT